MISFFKQNELARKAEDIMKTLLFIISFYKFVYQ